MDDLKDAAQAVLGLKGKRNDDLYARLSSRYTTCMLIVFAALVTLFQLGDYPITCWFPVHFHDSHEKFANAYCWVKNTYYLPYAEYVPSEDEPRQMVTYYQWVPFILLSQALFFKLPGILWNSLNSKAGLDADDIMISAGKLNKASNEDRRDNILEILTMQLDRFLSVRGTKKANTARGCKRCLKACCHCCGHRFGAYLVVLFLFVKLLYIANVLIQFFALNKILNTRYSKYGLEVMKGMSSDHQWQDSPYVAFPRVTLCDFSIRRLGNIHRYTLQCTLPLNLVNEKLYLFLWFWFVFVLFCSILGFIQWFIRCVVRKDRKIFLKNHLGTAGRVQKQDFHDDVHLDEFMDDYLMQDGMFLLRLISHNTNNITTREIIAGLWDRWFEKRAERSLAHGVKLLPSSNNVTKQPPGHTNHDTPSHKAESFPDTEPDTDKSRLRYV